MKHSPLTKSKPKRIIIREEYCMGCRLCEVHCVTQHSKSKDIIKAYKGEFPRPVSGIYFEEKGPISFALQCRHCDDAPCLEACLTGSMFRDKESGRVLHDTEKCVGCWMCIMACPYGARYSVDEWESYFPDGLELSPLEQFLKKSWEEKSGNGVATKCDFCLDRITEDLQCEITKHKIIIF